MKIVRVYGMKMSLSGRKSRLPIEITETCQFKLFGPTGCMEDHRDTRTMDSLPLNSRNISLTV